MNKQRGESKVQSPLLGTGERFRMLVLSLKRRGAKNPAALAAWIGRKKYGKSAFAQMALKARRRALARKLNQK